MSLVKKIVMRKWSSKLAIILTKRYQLQRMMKTKELKMPHYWRMQDFDGPAAFLFFLHKLDAYL